MIGLKSGAWAGVAILVVACQTNSKDAASDPAPAAAATGTHTAGAGSTAPNATVVPSTSLASTPEAAPWLSETEVKSAFEQWLRTQNEANFAAYSRLYAARFTGTKRVATRTSRFNRETWLTDREGMFKPGLSVKASDVQVTISGPQLAQVTFIQDFSTPRFSDRGKKQLLFTSTPEGLRVTAEEMLDSTVTEDVSVGPAAAAWYAEDNVLFTRSHLAKSAFGSVPRSFTKDNDGVYHLTAAASKDAFPATTTALEQEPLTLITSDGKSCGARVTRLYGAARIVPHFGMEQSWAGQDGHEPASRVEIAKQLWQLAGDEVSVVGEIAAACGKTGLLVKTADGVPSLSAPKPVDQTLEKAIRARFAKLPEIKKVEKEVPGRQRPWFSSDDVEVQVVEGPGGSRWAVARAHETRECRVITGVTAAFELDPARPDQIGRSFTFVGEPLRLIGMLTYPGDSTPTFFTGPRDLSMKYELWRPSAQPTLFPLASVSYFDCPC